MITPCNLIQNKKLVLFVPLLEHSELVHLLQNYTLMDIYTADLKTFDKTIQPQYLTSYIFKLKSFTNHKKQSCRTLQDPQQNRLAKTSLKEKL